MRKTAALSLLIAGLTAGLAAPAEAADVGVSISISQPGVYGRIDIGRFPQPVLIAPQPVLIVAPQRQVVAPVYLWVPPGHQKHWQRHCAQYNACGVPVYFVQERWYREHGPGREMAGGGPRQRQLERREDRREDRRDDHGDERRDERREGRGGEHGRGHGNGRD